MFDDLFQQLAEQLLGAQQSFRSFGLACACAEKHDEIHQPYLNDHLTLLEMSLRNYPGPAKDEP